MTDCKEWFQELTSTRDVVLDEDLAALQRMADSGRIERYNDIKGSEEEFLFEFSSDCPEFFTDAEQARVRSEFRLARLLLAASFHDEGQVPRALRGDFETVELDAVVDFEEYKMFDALTEEQIQQRIRRMEGEVYDLVKEYHSTQLSNLDELLEDPDVQQDVMERLVERYEDRFEKVRQGFYTFVETHGLEHVVETVEEAVLAVAEAEQERQQVEQELAGQLSSASETVGESQETHREVRRRIQSLERRYATGQLSAEELQDELATLRDRLLGDDGTGASLLERVEGTGELVDRLDQKIGELEEVREAAAEDAPESSREETAAVVEEELEELREEREHVQQELERLRRERERVQHSRERLEERQSDLESRVEAAAEEFDRRESALEETVEAAAEEFEQKESELEDTVEDVRQSLRTEDLEGDVVGAMMARLYEMDYVSRFDTSVQEADAIRTPEGDFEVPEGYWEGRSEHGTEYFNAVDMALDDQSHLRPEGQHARYEITDSRYLGLTRDVEMVLETGVHVDGDAFEANGFDAVPAGLDDLLGFVDGAIRDAEAEGYHHLLGIASPTGWTDRACAQLEDDSQARSRLSTNLSVVLIDLRDGSLAYDDTDPVAAENAELFEFPVDAERVEECRALVREEYAGDPRHDSVLLSDVVEDHGYPARVAKKALEELEDEGVGEQLFLDDLGMALTFA